ncbi:MAG: helix-turn-helix transcriptional regulator [Ruminococcus sp.]|nr:helix-turn-helix transcriptional regulator [Ruminococcus sp.]
MDSVTLGKKIKEARLKKKLTQNEVVGDFITRNMLSQIESGAANPSVKTLEYLCKVLEIPPNQLIDEQTSPTAGEYAQLRDAYIKGRYESVIDADDAEGFTDELDALKAKAYMKLAERFSLSEKAEELQRAIEYSRRAAEEAEKGIFADSSVKEQAQELIKSCAAKLSEFYAKMI